MQNSIIKLSIAAVLSCGLTAVCCADTESWQSPAYIINSFYKIALQNEYGASDHHLHKWQQSIHYMIIDHTGDKSLNAMLVEKQVKQLSEITGISISPVKQLPEAQLKILFSSEQTLNEDIIKQYGIHSEAMRQELIHNSICSAHYTTNPSGSLSSATVIIPVDRARAKGKLMSCVVEEITQIMGLPNDSVEVFPSIFNDRSYNQFLTGLDYVLLKLLYHPDLKAGMNRTQLQNLLPNIINSKTFQAIIQHAETNAQRDSLETLLQ